MARAGGETHPKLVFRDQSVGFVAKPHAYHAQRKRRWPVSKRSREEVGLASCRVNVELTALVLHASEAKLTVHIVCRNYLYLALYMM